MQSALKVEPTVSSMVLRVFCCLPIAPVLVRPILASPQSCFAPVLLPGSDRHQCSEADLQRFGISLKRRERCKLLICNLEPKSLSTFSEIALNRAQSKHVQSEA